MATFLVIVSSEIPYKVEKDFRVNGWDFHVAVRRACILYREYLRERSGKSKKLKSLTVKVTRL